MRSFYSYYDAPDDVGDFIATMMDEVNEFIIEKNPVDDPEGYDAEFRGASCVLESLVLAAMKDEFLMEAIRSHIQWAKAGYRTERRNIYDEARDLYEAMVDPDLEYERHCL